MICPFVLISDCINRNADVALVVDNSESIHDIISKEQFLKSFIIGIISDSEFDTGNIRFSLSVFTHNIHNEFYFNTYTSKEDMINHVNSVSHMLGGTDTGAAIENLVTNVFTLRNGDQVDAPNLAIIITDGRSNNNTYTVEWANIAKSMGIHLVCVGVGMHDLSELYQIASEPVNSNIFTVSAYSELFSIDDLIEDLFYEDCTGKHIYQSKMGNIMRFINVHCQYPFGFWKKIWRKPSARCISPSMTSEARLLLNVEY